MIQKAKIFGLILFLTIGQIAFGQTNKEKARVKGEEAIQLMDKGQLDESIKLLEEAQKLDPYDIIYPYEIAYAYYLKKDYKKVIKIGEGLLKHKDVTDRVYQLLGNSYDILDKSDKAIETYEAGLQQFPGSGNLYLEMGIMQMGKNDYNKALDYYEKGIEVAPKFPSNYYWASKIYCASNAEVWGIIYGEIFMNMERNSKRTVEISQLLYDTYKDNIKIYGDSSKIEFCDVIIDANSILTNKELKLPFCAIFGQDFIMSIIGIQTIDINSLDKIRSDFIENYFKNGHDKTYPNVLFNYQKAIKDAGHMEAYNHWVLMKGDENSFTKWQSGNKEKWNDFIKWFIDNKIKIDETNRFFSGQY